MTMPRNINLHLLEHLKALVAQRNVTRAAQVAHIGQPAMSANLARLRAMLKDPLLVKTARGMEPTPYALELVKSIQVALEALDAPQRMRSDFDIATAQRTVRVISTEAVSRLFLPAFMVRVHREAPGLTLCWTGAEMRRAAEFLREGDVDLVISSLRDIPPDYYSSPLYRQRACCIAAQGHPVIRGAVTLEQFVQFPHVVFGASPTSASFVDNLVDKALAALGHRRCVAMTVPSFLVAPPLVASSEMIAVVPERVATSGSELHPVQVMALPFDIGTLDLAMYWHVRCHADPVHQWLRASLRETAKGLA